MIFRETKLAGVYVIEVEPIRDERGFFGRAFCAQEFAAHGLKGDFVQCNISYNHKSGTLRGMHYQLAPHAESKLIRCTAGAVYDVLIDVRPASPTHAMWIATELTAQNRRMLFVPEGVAHGFQTLADESELFYQMSAYHHPESARGVRWDDPAFRIEWPSAQRLISARDQAWPDYQR